jgi:hypothetical protein
MYPHDQRQLPEQKLWRDRGIAISTRPDNLGSRPTARARWLHPRVGLLPDHENRSSFHGSAVFE